jgi:hypothetical protein
MYVDILIYVGPCSMHKSAKRVNIGRNSEMENPITYIHFIARSRKKAAVTPYFFIKYWNNMYLAILWCLQYVCFHEIWSSELGEHFQLFRQFLPHGGLCAVSKVVPLVHVIVNCLETALESFLGSIHAQECILCGILGKRTDFHPYMPRTGLTGTFLETPRLGLAN